MEPNKKRRQSIHEVMEENAKNCTRRRSLFDNPDNSDREMKKRKAQLDEWGSRWNFHNTDFVNVVKYSRHYTDSVDKETEGWIEGLQELFKKIEEFESECENIDIVEECHLSSKQKLLLEDVDSRIKKNLNELQTLLRKQEIEDGILTLKMDSKKLGKYNLIMTR